MEFLFRGIPYRYLRERYVYKRCCKTSVNRFSSIFYKSHIFFDIRPNPLVKAEGKFDHNEGWEKNDESHNDTSFV